MGARRRRGKSPKGQGATLDAAVVLRVFRESGKPLSDKEVARGLKGITFKFHDLRHLLEELREAGKLIRVQKGWGLVESMRLVTGVLEISRSGVGYVIPDDKRRKDIFIHPKDIGNAWHGDRVAAAVTRERKDKNHEGRVARVIERGITRLPCRVVKRLAPDLFLCRPTDARHTMSFMVDYLPPHPRAPAPAPAAINSVGIGEEIE